MGVQGLWEVTQFCSFLKDCFDSTAQVVNKAGQSRSLSNLAVIEGFEKNHSGNRAFRIGIGTVCTAKVARIQNSACYSFVYAHWRDYPFYHSLFLMAIKDPRSSGAARWGNQDHIT
jgi:hypothetical protein